MVTSMLVTKNCLVDEGVAHNATCHTVSDIINRHQHQLKIKGM